MVVERINEEIVKDFVIMVWEISKRKRTIHISSEFGSIGLFLTSFLSSIMLAPPHPPTLPPYPHTPSPLSALS